MKTITRTRIYLPMAGMILTLAIPAAAQTQVPFMGTFQGTDKVNTVLQSITQTITGTGTVIGQFSSVTTLITGPSGGTGTATWTAANGDTITTTVVGSGAHVPVSACQIVGAQPGDTYAKITQVHTITGGTGRFAGAQGGFVVTLYHDVNAHGPDMDLHGTCGSFGTITLAGADH